MGTALVALPALATVAAPPDKMTISIASGRTGGLYHPVAGAICQLVNEKTDQHGITCTVAFGDGSISNIMDMRDGDASMAMAQSDIHRDAVKGAGPFEEDGAYEDLRSMFALFVETVTVLARKDKDIASFEDLEGKRVYLPDEGSGGRVLMERLIAAEGWGPDAIDVVDDHEAPNLAQALCDNEFDAFTVAVGHPSPLVKEAAESCDAVLVPVAGGVVDEIIAADPMYTKSIIPGGTYRGNDRDVEALGLVATLVTTAGTKPEVAYHVTASFFEGLDRLAQESDLFTALAAEQMADVGLTAPLHAGARRYFEDAGLR